MIGSCVEGSGSLSRAENRREPLSEPSLATLPKPGILVVDDDVDVRQALGKGLQHHGFAVWLAADGREALELYQRRCKDIDMILLDVCMPGLNGPQTLIALKKLDPRVRCCFLSADLGGYTEKHLLGLGAARVLLKPVHLAEVAKTLRQLTRRFETRLV
jgi:DNA-binding response OmpR family regulator